MLKRLSAKIRPEKYLLKVSRARTCSDRTDITRPPSHLFQWQTKGRRGKFGTLSRMVAAYPEKYVNSKGFSLLEMMIVVVIIGVVSSVMISPFSSHGDEQKLILAAQEMTDALRFGRSWAMETGIRCRIE